MILRRRILDVWSHEKDNQTVEHVVCSYIAGAVEHGPRIGANVADCDRATKVEFSRLGLSVSQILPEELTREEVLLVGLADIHRRAARLIEAVEQFAGVSEDPVDFPTQRVLQEPALYDTLPGLTDQEKTDYWLLYDSACALAGCVESVEGFLSRVSRSGGQLPVCALCGAVRHGCQCVRCSDKNHQTNRVLKHVYFVSDSPEGEKVGL